MTDVCMLFQGDDAHPAHRAFGDAVNADYRHFETGKRPPARAQSNGVLPRIRTGVTLQQYETVIAEGTAPLQTLLSYKMKRRSTNAIYLAADETFYSLPERPTRHLWSLLGPLANRLLDGVVAVGRDVFQWAKPYIGDVPVRYVHPPISDEKYERLSALEPNSPQEPFRVLSAGIVKPANGYERLIDAVENLNERVDADVRVVLLGDGHTDQPYGDSPVVETPGFVDLDVFAAQFENASLYIQSSIGDSFPVATLEGLLSGTPTLVTTGVGVRELLPDNQIVDPTVDGLSDGIEWFLQLPVVDRTKIGADQRSLVEGLTESAQKSRFRTAITDLT